MVPSAFAPHHHHACVEEFCDESGSVNFETHDFDTWIWRVGFWASLHGQRTLLFVDATIQDMDDGPARDPAQRLHEAVLGGRFGEIKIGVALTNSTTAADIVATESDILWLADPSPSEVLELTAAGADPKRF